MENVACNTTGSAVGAADVEVLKFELDEVRELAEEKQIELDFAKMGIPDEVTITRERLARLCVYLGCHGNEMLTKLAAGVIRLSPEDFEDEEESASYETDGLFDRARKLLRRQCEKNGQVYREPSHMRDEEFQQQMELSNRRGTLATFHFDADGRLSID